MPEIFHLQHTEVTFGAFGIQCVLTQALENSAKMKFMLLRVSGVY